MTDTFLFFCLCSWSLAGVFGVDAVQSVSVTEGDSVTLNVTDIQTNDKIEWRFGQILIAEINIKIKESTFYYDNAGGRFRDRLKLDQTGSLIITNTSTTHSGLYTVTSSTRNTLLNTFNLSVYAPLPVPVITRDFSQCSSSSSSSSSSSCSLLCSVVNIQCLDQDKNSYSCVINNPIRHQTTHLDICQLCPPCSDCRCFDFTEAVIQLALSALVGVATVAVLVYEFRSSLQQKKRRKNINIKH